MRLMFIHLLTILIPVIVHAADLIAAGSTDVSVVVRLYDTSLAPATGETFSSVDCYYRRDGSAAVDVTEVTGGGLTTHLDNSFTEIEDGVYEYDLPDAAVASGARAVTFCCEDSDGSHTDFVQGCERIVLTDPLPTNFSDLTIASGTGEVTTGAFTAGALADMFLDDSGTTISSAVAGSVVKEIADNVTAIALSSAALADFFTTDSGETDSSAVAGSVVKEVIDEVSAGGGSGSSFGSNMSAKLKTLLYSDTGVTSSTVTGSYISTPQYIGSYYLKIDATENSAGGVTVTVVTNEENSGAGETVHTVALTATGVTRIPMDSVSGQKVLSRYLRTELSSLTGDWDVDVTLEYAPVK